MNKDPSRPRYLAPGMRVKCKVQSLSTSELRSFTTRHPLSLGATNRSTRFQLGSHPVKSVTNRFTRLIFIFLIFYLVTHQVWMPLTDPPVYFILFLFLASYPHSVRANNRSTRFCFVFAFLFVFSYQPIHTVFVLFWAHHPLNLDVTNRSTRFFLFFTRHPPNLDASKRSTRFQLVTHPVWVPPTHPPVCQLVNTRHITSGAVRMLGNTAVLSSLKAALAVCTAPWSVELVQRTERSLWIARAKLGPSVVVIMSISTAILLIKKQLRLLFSSYVHWKMYRQTDKSALFVFVWIVQ